MLCSNFFRSKKNKAERYTVQETKIWKNNRPRALLRKILLTKTNATEKYTYQIQDMGNKRKNQPFATTCSI